MMLKLCVCVKSIVYELTQGLNFIAGLLLLIVKDEEKTFSLVNTLLNKILPGTSSILIVYRLL